MTNVDRVAIEVRCLRCKEPCTAIDMGEGLCVILSHGGGWLRRQCPTSGSLSIAWKTPAQLINMQFRYVKDKSWVAVAGGPDDGSAMPSDSSVESAP